MMNANEARPVFPYYPFQGFPFLPKLPGDTPLHPSNQDGGFHHLGRNYHAPQSPPSSPPVGAGSLDLSRKNERISPNSFSGIDLTDSLQSDCSHHFKKSSI